MNVTAVKPLSKGFALIMEDGSKIWTPEEDKAKALIGKPIPSDWTQSQSDYGPRAFPPKLKGQGGGGGFRNTKEGQAYEQERMDRRTALMQAQASVKEPVVLDLANQYYTWLRATLPAAATTTTGGVHGEASGTTEREQAGPTTARVEATPLPASGCSSCGSIATSTKKPDGKALPAGFVRCIDCGTTEKRAA